MKISLKYILLLAVVVSVLGLQRSCDCRREYDPEKKNLPVSLVELFRAVYDIPSKSVPVIIWHGLGDFAYNQAIISNLIRRYFPSTHVYAVQVGSNEEQDADASIWGDVDSQVDKACTAIIENEIIKKKKIVNLLGFSQGALLSRALIERCPLEKYSIKVHNFISIGGPQQGIYGIPKNFPSTKMSSYLMTKGASLLAYTNYFQSKCIPATYWHNSKNHDSYRKNSFLADINNEGLSYFMEYRERFKSINKLVLVKFSKDSMINPPESSHFGFYKIGSSKTIEPMQETDLYKQDLIGLKVLHESKRIDFREVDGEHLDFDEDWFQEEIVKPYLRPDD